MPVDDALALAEYGAEQHGPYERYVVLKGAERPVMERYGNRTGTFRDNSSRAMHLPEST